MIWVACLWNALVSKLSGGESHEGNAKAPRTRTERLARQHHPRPADQRHLEALHRRLSLTGLTSNPTIFDQAIKSSSDYDSAIRGKLKEGKSGESLFFELAIEDLAQAADLFRPTWDRTNGVDGWVSLEVSPLLATTRPAQSQLPRSCMTSKRPNLFIKIPGTKEGLPAIEETIFAGVPVNVTLLFSREHYLAAAEAYLRGVERRIAAGLNPNVGSVASVFVSRWDAAVANKVPAPLHNRLGIAIAKRTYKDSLRVARLGALAAYLQRGWAATAPVMGEHRNQGSGSVRRPVHQGAGCAAYRQHHAGRHGERSRRSRRDWRDVAGRWRRFRRGVPQFAKAGVDVDALAATCRKRAPKSFVKSWNELMSVISAKTEVLKKAS